MCAHNLLSALRVALEQLGYDSTYHGYAAVFENPRDCEMWLEALDAKFNGKGMPFGRYEFDQLLGHCQVNTLEQTRMHNVGTEPP